VDPTVVLIGALAEIVRTYGPIGVALIAAVGAGWSIRTVVKAWGEGRFFSKPQHDEIVLTLTKAYDQRILDLVQRVKEFDTQSTEWRKTSGDLSSTLDRTTERLGTRIDTLTEEVRRLQAILNDRREVARGASR
jgi:hypothetical protein